MPPLTTLSGTLYQLAAPASVALVTSALSSEIGPSRVPDFLQGQPRVLESITRRDEGTQRDAGSSLLIYGTAGELPAMALEMGVTDRLSLLCTGLLCENVLVQGGLGWPTPIRRIGGIISRRGSQGALPWAMVALPIGRDLFLNGEALEAMTSSSRFNQIILLPRSETTNLVAGVESQPPGPSATTYLGGRLWRERQALLPKVAVHEASHYANILILDDWIEDNAKRSEENRDATFQRHCFRTDDGSFRVDFQFATLFLELSACLATGSFFEAILKTGEAEAPPLQNMMTESLVRGARYMTNARYQPYLQQAGIPSPDPRDAGAIMGAMRRFAALVPSPAA